MDDANTAHRAVLRIRDLVCAPRNWVLWQQRASLICYCLLVEAVAVTVTVLTGMATPIRLGSLVMLVALAGMGIMHAELSRQVERLRRRVNATPHINMTSVWTFAGVLLLPRPLVAVLVAALYAHLALRSWYRLQRVPVFRTVFNASLAMLTCYAAGGVLTALGSAGIRDAVARGWAGAPVIVAAGVTYFLVGALVALPGLTITNWSPRVLFGNWMDNLLEAATLCLGGLTALALATEPGLVVLVLPPLLVLHRGVLVKQLEIAAMRDEKTGLFNTSGWHDLASAEIARAARTTGATFGVLMVDLDHFKRINDSYGHLAGDAVLKAVAGTITDAVRDYDSVGRFGGEEFVVLLPGIAHPDVLTIAERIRAAISELVVSVPLDEVDTTVSGLSASIGASMYPAAGNAVERLLHAADTALYQAKNSGRNKVVSTLNAA